MTPSVLQDSLVADFKEQLSDILLKNAKGDLVSLNIYPQNLPAKKSQKDTDHYPYIIIRVMEGEDQDIEHEDTCKIGFIIGTFDDADNYQGYKDVMNLIEKVKHRLFTKQYYEKQFKIDYPFKWLIHDDDTYPYYFGGIESNWDMPKIFMDDNLI